MARHVARCRQPSDPPGEISPRALRTMPRKLLLVMNTVDPRHLPMTTVS